MDNIIDHIGNRTTNLSKDAASINNPTSNSSGASVSFIEINRRQVFTLESASEVLPVIVRITKTYSQKVDGLIERLDALSGASEATTNALESEVNSLIQEWQNKIQKLGALPKGLWIADFDAGDGYYCWKFPERTIEFWHRYSDGFSKRIHVSDRTKPISLQDRLRRKILSITPQVLQPAEIPE